jgi:hypothetical protein
MRTFLFGALVLFGIVFLSIASGRIIRGPAYAGRTEDGPERAPSQSANPVVVELFTSEGCSDCPPADRLLAHLQRTQPVPGAEIIALEEHVDYWNDLGWADPFSSSQFSDRQGDYARSFRISSPYTPQMIVDGTAQFVGSYEREALSSIAKALRDPKATVELEQIPDSKAASETARLRVRLGPLAGWNAGDPADVLLAITEDDLSSNVTRGENAGDQLDHRAVVRELRVLGRVDSAGSFAAEPDVNLAKDWKRENLRAVVFVQARASRHVLGAAALRLFPPGKPS